MRTLYSIVPNYGVTIILFTIIVKIFLIPLTIKQQKSTLKMQKVQPLIQELQAKYKNDKEKLNMETMKLYKEHGANPMSSCFPMLIQMPIMLSLWFVIQAPITYMMGISNNDIWQLVRQLHYWVYTQGWVAAGVAEFPETLTTALQGVFPYFGTSAFAEYGNIGEATAAQWRAFTQTQIEIAHYLHEVPEFLRLSVPAYGTEVPDFSGVMTIDFEFLGLDMSRTPQFTSVDIMWIIPILAAGSTYLSSQLMQKLSPQPAPAGADGKNPMQNMMLIFPLITGWMSFSFPVGVGFYWIISNILQTAQQWGANAYLRTKADPTEVQIIDVTKNRKGGKNHR